MFSVFCAVCFVSAAPPPVDGPDPSPALQRIRDKVATISANRTPAEVRAEIASWKRHEPNSPDPYIVLANYEFNLSRQPTGIYDYSTEGLENVPTPRSGAEEFSIVDPKTGKEVGILGAGPVGPKPDPETARKQQLLGAAELEAALKKFPDRLDIIIGRAIMLNEAQAWPELTAQMETALRRGAHDSQNLRWLEDQRPPRAPADEVLSALRGYIRKAFGEQSKRGDARALEWTTLGLKYFPDNVPLLSDAGSFYAFAEDYVQALSYYERAEKEVPDDTIVLGNLGEIYSRLGQNQNALRVAKRIIALNNDPEAVEQAQKIIEKLGRPTGNEPR